MSGYLWRVFIGRFLILCNMFILWELIGFVTGGIWRMLDTGSPPQTPQMKESGATGPTRHGLDTLFINSRDDLRVIERYP
jgi:hypothetical protein